MTYEEACKLKHGDLVVCQVARIDKDDKDFIPVVDDGPNGAFYVHNPAARRFHLRPRGVSAGYDREAFLRALIVGLVSNNGLLTPDAVFAGALRHRAKYEEHLEQAAQEGE